MKRVSVWPAAVGVLLAAMLAGCAPDPQLPPEPSRNPDALVTTEVDLEHDGVARSFRVTTPAAHPDTALPVLVALHGAGGSAATLGLLTGFDEAVADSGFVLVEPNGTGPDGGTLTWNAGTCCGTSVGQADDIGFLEAMLDRLAADVPVDAERVYLAGFSNGGMLAYRAACELGNRVAGIAVVAGAMNVEECPAPDPVPLLVIHGTADDVVPYEGGDSSYRDPRVTPWYNTPVEEAVRFWVERNGCSGPPEERTGGAAVVREWPDCAVELWTVEDGGHAWFGGPLSAGLDPEGAPPTTELVLDFFGLAESGLS